MAHARRPGSTKTPKSTATSCRLARKNSLPHRTPGIIGTTKLHFPVWPHNCQGVHGSGGGELGGLRACKNSGAIVPVLTLAPAAVSLHGRLDPFLLLLLIFPPRIPSLAHAQWCCPPRLLQTRPLLLLLRGRSHPQGQARYGCHASIGDSAPALKCGLSRQQAAKSRRGADADLPTCCAGGIYAPSMPTGQVLRVAPWIPVYHQSLRRAERSQASPPRAHARPQARRPQPGSRNPRWFWKNDPPGCEPLQSGVASLSKKAKRFLEK